MSSEGLSKSMMENSVPCDQTPLFFTRKKGNDEPEWRYKHTQTSFHYVIGFRCPKADYAALPRRALRAGKHKHRRAQGGRFLAFHRNGHDANMPSKRRGNACTCHSRACRRIARHFAVSNRHPFTERRHDGKIAKKQKTKKRRKIRKNTLVTDGPLGTSKRRARAPHVHFLVRFIRIHHGKTDRGSEPQHSRHPLVAIRPAGQRRISLFRDVRASMAGV